MDNALSGERQKKWRRIRRGVYIRMEERRTQRSGRGVGPGLDRDGGDGDWIGDNGEPAKVLWLCHGLTGLMGWREWVGEERRHL